MGHLQKLYTGASEAHGRHFVAIQHCIRHSDTAVDVRTCTASTALRCNTYCQRLLNTGCGTSGRPEPFTRSSADVICTTSLRRSRWGAVQSGGSAEWRTSKARAQPASPCATAACPPPPLDAPAVLSLAHLLLHLRVLWHHIAVVQLHGYRIPP